MLREARAEQAALRTPSPDKSANDASPSGDMPTREGRPASRGPRHRPAGRAAMAAAPRRSVSPTPSPSPPTSRGASRQSARQGSPPAPRPVFTRSGAADPISMSFHGFGALAASAMPASAPKAAPEAIPELERVTEVEKPGEHRDGIARPPCNSPPPPPAAKYRLEMPPDYRLPLMDCAPALARTSSLHHVKEGAVAVAAGSGMCASPTRHGVAPTASVVTVRVGSTLGAKPAAPQAPVAVPEVLDTTAAIAQLRKRVDDRRAFLATAATGRIEAHLAMFRGTRAHAMGASEPAQASEAAAPPVQGEHGVGWDDAASGDAASAAGDSPPPSRWLDHEIGEHEHAPPRLSDTHRLDARSPPHPGSVQAPTSLQSMSGLPPDFDPIPPSPFPAQRLRYYSGRALEVVKRLLPDATNPAQVQQKYRLRRFPASKPKERPNAPEPRPAQTLAATTTPNKRVRRHQRRAATAAVGTRQRSARADFERAMHASSPHDADPGLLVTASRLPPRAGSPPKRSLSGNSDVAGTTGQTSTHDGETGAPGGVEADHATARTPLTQRAVRGTLSSSVGRRNAPPLSKGGHGKWAPGRPRLAVEEWGFAPTEAGAGTPPQQTGGPKDGHASVSSPMLLRVRPTSSMKGSVPLAMRRVASAVHTGELGGRIQGGSDAAHALAAIASRERLSVSSRLFTPAARRRMVQRGVFAKPATWRSASPDTNALQRARTAATTRSKSVGKLRRRRRKQKVRAKTAAVDPATGPQPGVSETAVLAPVLQPALEPSSTDAGVNDEPAQLGADRHATLTRPDALQGVPAHVFVQPTPSTVVCANHTPGHGSAASVDGASVSGWEGNQNGRTSPLFNQSGGAQLQGSPASPPMVVGMATDSVPRRGVAHHPPLSRQSSKRSTNVDHVDHRASWLAASRSPALSPSRGHGSAGHARGGAYIMGGRQIGRAAAPQHPASDTALLPPLVSGDASARSETMPVPLAVAGDPSTTPPRSSRRTRKPGRRRRQKGARQPRGKATPEPGRVWQQERSQPARQLRLDQVPRRVAARSATQQPAVRKNNSESASGSHAASMRFVARGDTPLFVSPVKSRLSVRDTKER